MSLYWLRPEWTQACCANCGTQIWPEDDGMWAGSYGANSPRWEPTHYIPASWVEHAGAMREALKEVDRAVYSDDYANAALLTDFNQGLVDSALAATEWPKKETRDA